jgi:hypothetical protein
MRRHDTPPFIKAFQAELLQLYPLSRKECIIQAQGFKWDKELCLVPYPSKWSEGFLKWMEQRTNPAKAAKI